MRCLLLAALVSMLSMAAASGDELLLLGRVQHVSDGDTLTLAADDARLRVRLFQIDAPERGQPGSVEARRALANKVDGKYVRVLVETVDDYGRVIGTVHLGERDVNRELVREGHAWAYRDYLEDRSLLADEAAAKKEDRGLWRLPGPVPPWEWRQGEHSPTDVPRGEGCLIKGNINRKGDRIYHQPGDRHYDRTRIDTTQGERWFCSEEEAERAGWRSPRRS